jgi:U3 small nucleolar ribonucleoprotein protein IMP3
MPQDSSSAGGGQLLAAPATPESACPGFSRLVSVDWCAFPGRYNKLAGMATRLVAKLKELKPDDPFRIKVTDQLLDKLYILGVIPTRQSMDKVEHLSASTFCRRRLPVVMVKLKMCETLKEAVTFIEQGHVRVGPEVVTDPAFLVTRALQDFVTWVDSSKIKRTVMTYNDAVDDYDLQGN